ncbi:MAG: hypothetical protein GX437_00070 [Sphingobacteriales bacterium]|nr:hypothetical protein [Sphingobacteriales bacterium]
MKRFILLKFVLFFSILLIFFHADAQIIKVLHSDTLIYSGSVPDFVEKIVSHDSGLLWLYYDYTDCADFFLQKTNKDSSFVAFLNKNNIRVYNYFSSFDGYTDVRCDLCKCPNGKRFNFKISIMDYQRLINLFSGTMNQQKFIRY